MGVNLLDIAELGAGIHQQVVVHLQPEGADNGEIVLDHQVIDLLHRTGGGVFNGQDAVLAHALLNGGKHRLEILEIQDEGVFEDLLAGDLGVGALHALAGHHGGLGEQLGGLLDGLGDLAVQGADLAAALALIAAAQLEDHGVQHPGVIGHVRTCLLRHVLELCPLPGGDKNGGARLLFAVGDLSGHVHPGAEEAHQLVVNFVDVLAQFIQFHFHFLLVVWVLPSIRS